MSTVHTTEGLSGTQPRLSSPSGLPNSDTLSPASQTNDHGSSRKSNSAMTTQTHAGGDPNELPSRVSVVPVSAPANSPIEVETQASPSPQTNQVPAPYPRVDVEQPTQSPASSDTRTSQTIPKPWVSRKLYRATIMSLLAFTISLIAGITVLVVLSHYKSGFAPISTPSSGIGAYIWHKGLLWTVLPNLIFSIYRIFFDAVVMACSDRQPYVELWAGGTSPEKTILLDYRAKIPVWNRERHALHNGHRMLAASFVIALAVSLGVGPLSARLFSESTVTFNRTAKVNQTTVFDDINGFNLTNIVPILDTVAATSTYGAQYPPWTNKEFGFRNFTIPDLPAGGMGEFNFSATTTGYSASLDCVSLGQFENEVSFVATTPTSGTIIINAVDRGCSWSYSLSTSFSFEYYLHTQAWLTCSYESGRTRLFAVGARVINGSHALNFTAISCKTSYVSTNGELSISLPPVVTPSTIPTIVDFKANTSSAVSGPPSWSIPYEAQLHQPAIVDNTATTSATLFGRLVFDFARSNFPDTYLQPEALSNATQLIFSSAYATLVAASTFKPAPQTRIAGTLSLSATRLIVVPPVAYTILAILALAVLILIWIIRYTQKHPSILYEEPIGLMGHAGVLYGSGVNEVAAAVRDPAKSSNFVGKTLSSVREGNFLENKRCRMERWEEPREARIVVESEPVGENRPLSKQRRAWRDRLKRSSASRAGKGEHAFNFNLAVLRNRKVAAAKRQPS